MDDASHLGKTSLNLNDYIISILMDQESNRAFTGSIFNFLKFFSIIFSYNLILFSSTASISNHGPRIRFTCLSFYSFFALLLEDYNQWEKFQRWMNIDSIERLVPRTYSLDWLYKKQIKTMASWNSEHNVEKIVSQLKGKKLIILHQWR